MVQAEGETMSVEGGSSGLTSGSVQEAEGFRAISNGKGLRFGGIPPHVPRRRGERLKPLKTQLTPSVRKFRLIALAIIEGFSLGSSFVVGIVISILVSAALSAYEKGFSMTSDSSGHSAFSSNAVHGAQDLANVSSGVIASSSNSNSSNGHVSNSNKWAEFAQDMAILFDLVSFKIAWIEFVYSFATNAPLSIVGGAVLGFVLAVLSVSFDIYSGLHTSESLAIAGIIFGVFALLAEEAFPALEEDAYPGLQTLDDISTVLGIAGVGVGVGLLAAGD